LKFKIVKITPPEGVNIIIGQSHFIKSVEDIYESLMSSMPTIKFGLAFCESSGMCLIRHEGNDDKLRKLASETAFNLSSGHAFIVFIKNAYPINVLNSIKEVPEVCKIYCATANPVEVIIVETDQGRGIIGVVDGFMSKGIENDEEIKERKDFLRKIGYKL